MRQLVPAAPVFPINYEAAKKALAECASIDECKEWKDRAAAIESYALQKRDRSMEHMAARIRLRAEKRMGEEINAAKKLSGKPLREVLKITNVSAAEATSARALTRVKRDVFEAHVERTPPTPRSRIVKMGQSSIGADMSAPVWRLAERMGKQVREFPIADLIESIRGMSTEHKRALKNSFTPVAEWFDAIGAELKL